MLLYFPLILDILEKLSAVNGHVSECPYPHIVHHNCTLLIFSKAWLFIKNFSWFPLQVKGSLYITIIYTCYVYLLQYWCTFPMLSVIATNSSEMIVSTHSILHLHVCMRLYSGLSRKVM